MSKSHKKQLARKRAAQATDAAAGALPPAPAPTETESPDQARARKLRAAHAAREAEAPALAMPTPDPRPIDQALFDLVVAAATHAGQMRDEGERLAYVYNGESLAVKYVEPSEDGSEAATLLVAAFRRGVVYQVRDGAQVVFQPGDWQEALAALSTAEPPAERDEPVDDPDDLPADEDEGDTVD